MGNRLGQFRSRRARAKSHIASISLIRAPAAFQLSPCSNLFQVDAAPMVQKDGVPAWQVYAVDCVAIILKDTPSSTFPTRCQTRSNSTWRVSSVLLSGSQRRLSSELKQGLYSVPSPFYEPAQRASAWLPAGLAVQSEKHSYTYLWALSGETG
jgi:hypothetical protein